MLPSPLYHRIGMEHAIEPLNVKKPRVEKETFSSTLLLRYMRRTPNIDALITLFTKKCLNEARDPN